MMVVRSVCIRQFEEFFFSHFLLSKAELTFEVFE
jgi:hypothetical protein